MQTPALSCAEISDDMIRLLDGELDAIRVAEISTHFRACDGCAGFYASLREQLVLHQWADDEAFDLDEAEGYADEIPDYDGLAERLRAADLHDLGRALYEILKAEFLFDYGDGIAVDEEPIDDPRAERARGSDLVEEIRDWHDADEVDGVDLVEIARRMRPPSVDDDRLDQLVAGMAAVAELAPSLALAATYYQGLAHVKAGREAAAAERMAHIVEAGPSPLLRASRIALATLPALLGGRPDESIPALEACLIGDAHDPIVRYNLAKAHFIRAGGQLDVIGRGHLEQAWQENTALVERQLGLPSERPLRDAWQAVRGRAAISR